MNQSSTLDPHAKRFVLYGSDEYYENQDDEEHKEWDKSLKEHAKKKEQQEDKDQEEEQKEDKDQEEEQQEIDLEEIVMLHLKLLGLLAK